MSARSAYALLLTLVLVSCQPKAPTQGEMQVTLQQDSVASTEAPIPASTHTEILTAIPTPSLTPKPTPILPLDLVFADSDWDGKTVPNGQQCQRQGGENPSTPRILVSNIPEGSDAIILEFSDRDYRPMDDGGHGKIGFMISEGTREAVIPSILGHSFNLPNDFFIIQEHQASSFDTAGAYMPPCSGGIGNSYYVTVRAVELLSKEDKTFILLGQGILELGRY